MQKIEDQSNNTIFVEAQDTQVANAWDTLIFDCSNTNELNLSNCDKLAFYDFWQQEERCVIQG